LNIEGLNPEQRRAVESPPGPLLILAGAGTGKTRVLTHRIARLIEHGCPAESILAVTFTNKAAREMKERVAKISGPRARYCWIGTFHSISARILRRECERIGYRPSFTIYDSNDQKRLIKKIIRESGYSDQQIPPSLLQSKISGAKNHLITPDAYQTFDDGFESDRIARVYDAYQKALKSSNAMDFDDLIANTVYILRSSGALRQQYQAKFMQVLVDEYQDTNIAQFHWVKALAENHKHITVVGDDDQSIYGWRGATLENILKFEQVFAGALTIRLEQNYRSTPQILEAANQVISNNRGRKGKELWTKNRSGANISVTQVENEEYEAGEVIREIENQKGASFSDFSILYRTNAQSRALEDALRLKGIPYVIVGGLRFYERREVKDILAYLHITINPEDNLSLLRIINAPKRGIGARSQELVDLYAQKNSMSLLEAVHQAGDVPGLSRAAALRIKKFGNLIKKFQVLLKNQEVQSVIEAVIEETEYIASLEKEQVEDSDDRINNVREIARAVDAYVERTEGATLQGFLEEVALLSDIDSWDDDKDAVSLMTLHSAKGLEFPTVFITGMEQGLFPLIRTTEDEEDLEEERRLFYVGLTRARKRAHILYARNRRRYGVEMFGTRSMFIDEMGTAGVDRNDTATTSREVPVFREAAKPKAASKKSAMPNYEDFSQEHKTFQKGGYVRHPAWGNGQILNISGFGNDAKLTISFDGVHKKVLAQYAKLDIL